MNGHFCDKHCCSCVTEGE